VHALGLCEHGMGHAAAAAEMSAGHEQLLIQLLTCRLCSQLQRQRSNSRCHDGVVSPAW
jgi:hypothetical protein